MLISPVLICLGCFLFLQPCRPVSKLPLLLPNKDTRDTPYPSSTQPPLSLTQPTNQQTNKHTIVNDVAMVFHGSVAQPARHGQPRHPNPDEVLIDQAVTVSEKNMATTMHPQCTAVHVDSHINASNQRCNARNACLCTPMQQPFQLMQICITQMLASLKSLK